MVDEIAHLKPFYYIWGGEPYLYPDIIPLMEHMKKRNGMVGIVTNGTMMAKTADRLVRAGVDMLMLSVDGVGPVHNEIRQEKRAWEMMMEGLDAVLEEKRRQKSVRPYINVLNTVSRDNVGHLEDIADWGAEKGIDLLTYYYSWFTNEETGHEHERVMQERFGVTPSSWQGYLFFRGLDAPRLQAESLDQEPQVAVPGAVHPGPGQRRHPGLLPGSHEAVRLRPMHPAVDRHGDHAERRRRHLPGLPRLRVRQHPARPAAGHLEQRQVPGLPQQPARRWLDAHLRAMLRPDGLVAVDAARPGSR
jgi:hypothetical protein